MPFAALILISLMAGLAAYAVAVRLLPSAGAPARAVEREAAEQAQSHPALRRLLRARLDPELAGGLALSAALVAVIAGAAVVALLAMLLRASQALVELDRAAAGWGNDHAGALSTRLLNLVTDLGTTPAVVVMATVVAVLELWRAPSRWIVPFLLVVTVGDGLATVTVKGLIDRARPTLNPVAETLGPSFPSGHSSIAAAFFAAAALLFARRRRLRARALLAAAAVSLAVAVACSRVLLDLHWLSDVIAGLALGWAWFAACAIAFGGRMLEFGDSARRTAAQVEPRRSRETVTTGR